MASRQQVADRAGVSVAVVSYVLNNRKLVKEETRQKVLEAVRELGYRPNLVARSLKTKKSKQIAVLVRFLGNPFEAGLLLTIEAIAKASGGYFVFFQTYEEAQEEQLKELFMGRVDGILLLGQYLNEATLDYFTLQGIPIVSVTRPYPEAYGRYANVLWIDIDWHEAMRMLVRHLRDSGHERIAFMADSSSPHHYEWRYRAFIEALEGEGLQFHSSDRLNGCGRFELAYAELAQRLKSSSNKLPFTALVCANDLMAAGCLAACRDQGAAVPGQLAVAGCEDILMSSQTNPPLTALGYPRPEAAQAAATLLIALMEERQTAPPAPLLAAELKVRGSTLTPSSSNGSAD